MKILRSRPPLYLLILNICIILIILSSINGCSRKEKVIQVEHGKSIAGVELGMLEKQVFSILGVPNSQLNKEDMDKLGGIYDISPNGKYEKVPLQEMKIVKTIIYQKPPLTILIDQYNKVNRLSLSYCENVSVKGYPFLQFKYLTQDELTRLGRPHSQYRMKQAEQMMMSKAPKGIIYEYYEYFYDTIGINLGLVFDRTKGKNSKYFIGVNHIDVYSTQNK